MWASPAIWITDLVALLTIGLLAIAAASDLATRTIPDQVCIALALLGVGARLFAGVTAVALSVVVAVALFALLVLAHARGALGGGDVKLAAAMAVGLAPLQTYRFVVATVLAGGVLSLLHLLLRRAPPPARLVVRSSGLASLVRRIATVERWRIRRKGSLPYGIAIACGGAWVTLAGLGG
jgi:prepilin peptidase CpaA